VTLYRWRDAQGGLHYGDQPPEDARELRALRIDPEVNVVKAFQTEVAEEESESEEATDQQDVSEPPALAQENDSLNQRHEQLQELIEITGKLLPGASR
jgi:FtsZ-binding cell division protein ZapB